MLAPRRPRAPALPPSWDMGFFDSADLVGSQGHVAALPSALPRMLVACFTLLFNPYYNTLHAVAPRKEKVCSSAPLDSSSPRGR